MKKKKKKNVGLSCFTPSIQDGNESVRAAIGL